MEKEDLDFMSELEAAANLKPAAAANTFLWLVCFFFFILFIFLGKRYTCKTQDK